MTNLHHMQAPAMAYLALTTQYAPILALQVGPVATNKPVYLFGSHPNRPDAALKLT